MADFVQYKLEKMVDELEDMERKGLFTTSEIKLIVKKRRDFEYRLKRPSPLKQDYVAYIDYETQLENLRKLRKKAIFRESKGVRKKWKKSISDVAGVSRVVEIYRRAVARFKGDMELWFRYLEFCRVNKHVQMKRALADAIRFHPTVPGLWIYVAAWEFDQNLNVAAARALMQGGLRACPESEDLWIEYLRMELTYIRKLIARKVALSKDVNTALKVTSKEEEKWKNENTDVFMRLSDQSTNSQESDGKEVDEDEDVHALKKHGADIFRAIYCEAVASVPLSLNLRKRILAVLDSIDVLEDDQLRREIMERMHQDFSHDEDYWDWLARIKMAPYSSERIEDFKLQLKKATQVYEESLTFIPSSKMFTLYARFWSNIIIPEEAGSETLYNTNFVSRDMADFIPRLLEVYERAYSSGCITEDLGKHCILLYLKLGRVEEARQMAVKICDKLPDVIPIWDLRISIEMKWAVTNSASLSGNHLASVYELLKQILTRTSVSEAETLWHKGFKIFANEKYYFDKLSGEFTTMLAGGGSSDQAGVISSTILNVVLQSNGIDCAREMYRRILALPHPSLAIYKHCTEMELNLAVMDDRVALANARKLFDSAISFYEHKLELWQSYYQLELKVGTAETANAVFWRARKALQEEAEQLVQHAR